MSDLIHCEGLGKRYAEANNWIEVLKDIDFSIKKGSRIAIMGPSGSGKSTFLHLLGGLEVPTSGMVKIQGQDWRELSEKTRCQLRNQHLGFIYQFHHLLPEFTAFENVAMPLLLAHTPMPEIQKRVLHILTQVGLEHRLHHKPSQLSGGERQRVAIARALIHSPACVLADEPTGNLDTHTAASVFDLMLELNSLFQTALVVVTHDEKLAKKLDQCFVIQKATLSGN